MLLVNCYLFLKAIAYKKAKMKDMMDRMDHEIAFTNLFSGNFVFKRWLTFGPDSFTTRKQISKNDPELSDDETVSRQERASVWWGYFLVKK